MGLSDRAAELAAAESTTAHAKYVPPGWEPGVMWDGHAGTLTTQPLAAPPTHWNDLLAVWDLDPAVFEVVEPVQYRAWDGPTAGGGVQRLYYYRATIRRRRAAIDVDALFKAIGRRRKPGSTATSTATFVYACGDLQIGKPDGDGTEGTIRRFYASLDRATDRYKQLRRRGHAGPVLLAVVGDCPEGTQSQGGRLVGRLDLTLTEQIRVLRRLFADQVSAFANLTDQLTVAAVPGNHGEAQRTGDQMSSRYDDNWDIEAIVQVADLMNAKGYDGIQWAFPARDQLHLAFEASGTRIGMLHGHQTRGKMQTWLAAKALDRDPIGTCDVVLSGHHHTLRLEHLGPTTWMQTGALDGGSTWWTHKGGLSSPPAAITFVTADGRWNGLEVV